eukprot:15448093-Alexandrium_andersonii.AAC.1
MSSMSVIIESMYQVRKHVPAANAWNDTSLNKRDSRSRMAVTSSSNATNSRWPWPLALLAATAPAAPAFHAATTKHNCAAF